ncbi:MAG TPA: hypothetical protein VML55_14755 [Planctomycetaceae bacterium]|nr:hypothetical protein [Planctomycetaceae bacterium]
MDNTGVLLHCDEAVQRIERIENPVTRSLVNMAFVHLVKTVHLERSDAPCSDLDALFLVRALEQFFSEHEVLARALDGEPVGAWFDGA